MKKVTIYLMSLLLFVSAIFQPIIALAVGADTDATNEKSWQDVTEEVTDASNDLVNVAIKGEASASQETSDNTVSGAENINDGDISLNSGSFWDSGKKVDENPFIVLDLKDEYEIEKLHLYNYWGPIFGTDTLRIYKYKIYTSLDNKTWGEPIVIKDNENVATKDGDVYTLDTPLKARYVKVECIDSNIDGDITHIVELQVFAKPKEKDINIALNKQVNAAQGNTALITDGNLNNYWDGGEAPQSFEIDLGGYYQLDRLHAYPYYGDGRYYHYDIYASDNGVVWEKIAEKNNDDVETAKGSEFKISEDIKAARYIRVNMTYNSANSSVHMKEFEVYGTEVEDYEPTPIPDTDPSDEKNIAYRKTTRANSSKNYSKNIVDGSLDTYWSAFTTPTSVDIDLGETYKLSDAVLFFPYDEDRYYQYSVYTSLDGVNFDRIHRKHNHDLVSAEGDVVSFNNKEARYVRVNVEGVSEGSLSFLSEIRIHGEESDTPSSERKELTIPSFEGSEYDKEITKEDTINEVYALVERRLGSEYKNWFEFDLENTDSKEDFYTISNADGKIRITGNEGVSLTTGLNHYLKYYCKVEISQQTEQVNMPKNIVPVEKEIRKSTPLTARYAYNYCTLSYTNAFYGEEEWQRELDWLALNGVNLVLDTTGQEAVWIDFLQKIGYSTADAEAWLVGPGYIAWQFMSNMENYGGPINDQYVLDRLELARKNQYKMRLLGMDVVLQGYSGMIPSDYENVVDDKENPLHKQIINAMMPQGLWGGQFIRPDMLKTNSEVFVKCAELFYESQEDVLGDVSHYYATDPFHEGGIPPTDMTTEEISRTVLREMMKKDPDAVWIIQSWDANPTEGLLNGLDEYREDHALILDLNATADPRYNNSNWGNEFHETSWVYCMLDNYGDRPGVHGELEVITSQIYKARNSTNHMKGIGITPEGMQLNPVNYELFFETAWEDTEIDVEEWLKDYVERRYGTYSESAYQGWLKLLDTAYGASGGHSGAPNSIANFRPEGISPILGNNKSIPYNTNLFNLAVKDILKDYDKLCSSEGYLYDVAALLQQILQNSQLTYYNNFVKAFEEGNLEEFDKNAELFLDSILVVDKITGTQQDGLLGEWIGKAKDRSADYDDFTQDMFEFNARSLITTWGGRTCARTLGDYAYRQYSGLESDYVYPRWEKYLQEKREALVNNTEFNGYSYDDEFNRMWDFTLSNKEYTRQTTDAKTELKTLSKTVFETYTMNDRKEVKDDNIAVNGFPSSKDGVAGGRTLEQAIDNDESTLWVAGSSQTPASYELTLEEISEVYSLEVIFEKGPAADRGLFTDFYVEVYSDGAWEKVLEGATEKDQYKFSVDFNDLKEISKVKVTITDVDGTIWPAIAELKVYSSRGIQSESLTIENDKLLLSEQFTVAQLKEHLYADVGEINISRNGSILSDDAIVKNGDTVSLKVRDIKVDDLEIAIDIEKADYSKVDEAINMANSLDKNLYKDFSKVEEAISNVVRDLDITKQNEVDAMAKAINDAVKALEYKDADYSKVDEIISTIPKDLDKYTKESVKALNEALDAIVRDLDIMHQTEVNKMAADLLKAVEGLQLQDKQPTTPEDKPEQPETSEKEDGKDEVETGVQINTELYAFGLLTAAGAGYIVSRRKRKAGGK